MRDTTEEDIVFKNWLNEIVFPKSDVFCSDIFDISQVLFEEDHHQDFLSSEEIRGHLNTAIHKAAMQAFFDNEAKWFHVNINNGQGSTEDFGWYVYNEPFASIVSILENPSNQETTHYTGIASATNNWMILFHAKKISIHGNERLISLVKKNL